MTLPICIDCAHFRNGYGGGECRRTSKTSRDLVDGELRTTGTREARAERFIPFVDAEREADRCGKEGKHFTPKPTMGERRVKARGFRFWRWLTNPFGQGIGDH